MTGDELRRTRRRLGLTQVQMAESVGIHSNTIARQERGEVGIGEPLSRLVRLMAKQRPTPIKRRGRR